MRDLFKALEELQKEAEMIKEASQETEKDFVKEAAEYTGGLVKTAEEAELFHLGRIFGQGMAIGYLEKLAQAAEEVAAQEADMAGVPEAMMEEDYTETPQQVEAEPVDESEEVQYAMKLKQILQNLTPAQIVTWYEQLDEESKNFVDNEPELSAIVDNAYRMISLKGAPTGVEEAEDEVAE